MSAADPPLWTAYDAMGAAYAVHAADGPYNAHYDRPAVLAALGEIRGLRVLDAACGPGLYFEELLARGAEVGAFDASEAMVAEARARCEGRIRVDVAVLGEVLPYPDASFERVLCALAIHYADDRSAAFRELFRVLVPGGLLVVSTQHPTIDWLRWGGSYFDVALETDTWGMVDGDRQVSFWREPMTALCAAATDSGFLIERLVEPLPDESMRAKHPDHFELLSRDPGFLMLCLVKPIGPVRLPR